MGDSLQSFVCRICNVTCTGPETLQQHLQGIKHLKKERQSKMYGPVTVTPQAQPTQFLYESHDYSCKVCQTVMSGPEAFLAHMAGKPHAKKLRQQELIKAMSLNNSLDEFTQQPQSIQFTPISEGMQAAQPGSSGSYHFCSLCNVPLSGPESASSHYAGAQHLKNKKRSQYLIEGKPMQAQPGLTDSFSFCSLCQVTFSGPESADAHYAGAQHRKKLRQSDHSLIYTDPHFAAMEGNFSKLNLTDKPENIFKECNSEADVTEELRKVFSEEAEANKDEIEDKGED